MQFWSWTLRLEQLFFEDESLHFGDCLLPRNNCSRVVQLEGHHGGKVEPLSDVLLAHSITKIKVDINFLQELYVGQHDIFEPECTENLKRKNLQYKRIPCNWISDTFDIGRNRKQSNTVLKEIG